jgi:histone deacetylase 6
MIVAISELVLGARTACVRRCRVTPEGYAHMTHMLSAVAPLAVLLEGGYNLQATAAGCEAVLRVLLGQKVPAFSRPAVPSTAGLMAIQQVIKTQVCIN